ncbi:MAG: hypothetical protein M3133_00695, partial [Actinomycetota bacterium]|nr:hypothetical protein [Actinomycetota bacterium]
GDSIAVPADADDLGVRVLAVVHGRDTVQQLLNGWEQAIAKENSVAWLIDRLRTFGGALEDRS